MATPTDNNAEQRSTASGGCEWRPHWPCPLTATVIALRMELMNPATSVMVNRGYFFALICVVFCLASCVSSSVMRREPNATLVETIEQHGGRIEYHRGLGSQSGQVKAISLPATALREIDPVALHVFPGLRVLHLREIPCGASGDTYETACCVNGKAELAKLAGEYRKAGLMR